MGGFGPRPDLSDGAAAPAAPRAPRAQPPTRPLHRPAFAPAKLGVGPGRGVCGYVIGGPEGAPAASAHGLPRRAGQAPSRGTRAVVLAGHRGGAGAETPGAPGRAPQRAPGPP